MRRHSYVIEILILYMGVVALNHFFFPDIPGFIGINPHPYWLGVLLFGMQNGVIGGAVAGGISALLYMGTTWFYLERYVFEDFSFYVLPALFLIVGILVGVGVHRYRSRIARLDETLSTRDQTIRGLEEEVATLKQIKEGLERRVVTRMATLVTLYQGARILDSTDLDTLYPGITEFVAKTLGASQVSIYLKSGDGWKMTCQTGWPEYQQYPLTLKMGEGLIGIAGASGKVVSVRDYADRPDSPQLMADALMAGPLRQGEKGEVVAVVAIQDLPFLSFNSATASLFSFLLEWASRAVGHAHDVQVQRAQEIVDPEFQVFSYSYFQSRAEQEWQRSKTYYLPLSIGLAEVNGLHALPRKQRDYVRTVLSSTLKSCSRPMDVVAVYPEPDIPFAVLLPTTSPRQAEEIREKMMQAYEGLRNPMLPPLSLKFSNFTPQTQDLSSLVANARSLSA